MEIYNSTDDMAEEAGAKFQNADKSTGFVNVRNIIADKLQNAADALGEKAAEHGTQGGMAQYAKQASGWLDQSSRCVRQFDYEQADAKVREAFRQNPGRSLVIAGLVGLVIGAIWGRR